MIKQTNQFSLKNFTIQNEIEGLCINILLPTGFCHKRN